ncbi:LexA family protein [Pontibacter sp. JAM-7]|uniref:LexA family protein n=1 Tax=Pontibacter sp. JAM-7 TaxID=3366581 RepID=UPI003AF879FF
MDIKFIRRNNLRALLHALYGDARGSKRRLGEAVGIDPSYISRCLMKVPMKNIGEDLRDQIEQSIGLAKYEFDDPAFPNYVCDRLKQLGHSVSDDYPELMADILVETNQLAQEVREPSNLTYAPDQGQMRKYPVISSVQAGAWKEAIDLFQPGDAECWEEAGAQYSDQSFWLRVTGDSMTSPAGLSIPEGYLILVDPNARADNGSLVVAKLEDSDEVTFKKLVIDAGQHYLKPLNPNYGTIHINGNCRIVGVVREVKLKI